MKCCQIGHHLCEKCGNEFSCGGAGGFSGQTTDYFGRVLCEYCYETCGKPSICRHCFLLFTSTTKLFNHLNENPEHKCDIPKTCNKCGKLLMAKSMYDGTYYKINDKEFFIHYVNCS